MNQTNTDKTNGRAVSPVIGVILMVAITVILAAVIGAFVLGLGDTVQQTAPNANFEFSYDDDNGTTITHSGGDTLDPEEVFIMVSGHNNELNWDNGDSITAGDSVRIISDGTDISFDDAATGTDIEGETVRLVWRSGGQSSTLATYDI